MKTEIDVRVTPRSRQRRLEWAEDGTLRAWLTAPPVEGQANEALIDLVAKTLGVAKRTVSLVRGEASRNKRICIDGIELNEVKKRLS